MARRAAPRVPVVDYASMPQALAYETEASAELMDAVNSIPSYVERAALVLVLAPPCVHANTGKVCNYKTWRQRGWHVGRRARRGRRAEAALTPRCCA